jgi:hypothetical protein
MRNQRRRIKIFAAILAGTGFFLNLNNAAHCQLLEFPPKVWIAARTDGQAGTGTVVDPFDGSTRSKLDALWPTIVSGGPTKVTFAPGLYLTNGSLRPISNCTIDGYGATLKLDTGAGVTDTKRSIFQGDSATNITNCTIEGFTLDDNLGGQTASQTCMQGVTFYGSNNHIIHNTFVGWGTKSASNECFVSIVSSSNSVPASGNEIGWNEYTSPGAGSNGCCITLFGTPAEASLVTDFVNPNATWNFGGRLHHNYIHDISGISIAVNGAGVGAWTVGQQVTDNLFLNVTSNSACIYSDTGASWSAVVARNILINVDVGIVMTQTLGGGHINNNLTIENNTVSVRPGNPSYGIVTDNGPFPGAIVRANQVYRHGSSGTVQIGYSLRYIQNGKAEGNTAGPNIAAGGEFSVGHYTGLLVKDNSAGSITDEANGTGLVQVGNRSLAGVRLDLAADRTEAGSNSFHARIPQSGAIANGTNVPVVFATALVNPGGQYNSSNGRFTPARPGDYDIAAFVSADGTGTSGRMYLEIWKNGAIEISQSVTAPNYGTVKVVGRVTANGTNDYFTVNWWANVGPVTFSLSSYASGFWASKVD